MYPPPESKKQKLWILAGIVIIAVIIIGVVVATSGSAFQSQKVQVSNMEIGYGSQTILGINLGGSGPVLSFTVQNEYSSSLDVVGCIVNGVNYGTSALIVAPGQTQSNSISLQSLALSSSTTYAIKLTFTFADGKYQDYAGSYVTSAFYDQAQITHLSLSMIPSGLFGQSSSSFQITIQNTGTTPISSVNCNVQGYNWPVTMLGGTSFNPGESESGGWGDLMLNYQVGQSYSVSVQITFLDGTTQNINTSVTAQAGS